MMQRRVFAIKEGYMGLAPLNTSSADQIIILFGGDIPFLLREAIWPSSFYSLSGEMVPCWLLIRDCYVHGILDREAMDNHEARQTRYFLRWERLKPSI